MESLNEQVEEGLSSECLVVIHSTIKKGRAPNLIAFFPFQLLPISRACHHHYCTLFEEIKSLKPEPACMFSITN
jgi:hypothetical protein